MVDRHSDRFFVFERLTARKSTSTFSWFTHANDQTSFGRWPNFPKMVEHFGLGENGGKTKHGDVLAKCNWEAPPNAHALPGTVLPFIELTDGEKPKFEINPLINLDFSWQ